MEERKILFTILLFLSFCSGVMAQGLTFGGTVTEKDSGDPIEFATVIIEGSGQWAVADADGRFTIKNVPAMKTVISVSCLGYVGYSREITLSKDILNFGIKLSEDNLSIESAVVTAQENNNLATTTRTIDKTALDHVQVMNVSDITSLLPGGATTNPTLTDDQRMIVRGSSSEGGNASFGTAVEVDGVRLSNNASFTNTDQSSDGMKFYGKSTNNIASSNIESVEVITGVPSVEYGDMTSGVVKINTKKGKTPLTVTLSTSPRTKQVSASKGFGMGRSKSGRSRGVVNASIERTNSVTDQRSPYTSYDRNQISLIYSNTFNGGALADFPVRFSAGVTGNLGGLNDSSDPDKMLGTYEKVKDNTVRGNVSANWLLSKSWITNVELNASVSYSDNSQRSKKNYHGAVSTVALHTTQTGYYMAVPYVSGGDISAILIPPGDIWYNEMFLDDKPFNSKVSLKANWAKHADRINNKLKIGADWTADKNFGRGEYSEDIATAPTFREYRFDKVPVMSTVSAYIEDNFMLSVGRDGRINFIAGLRNDNTVIPESVYGMTSSLSPRFNFKYTAFTEKFRRDDFVKELSFRGSWGVAVKQPSFSVLYPQPSYFDINVFTSTASSDNTVYRAFYVMPRTIEYNPSLRWQKNRQAEVGFDINLDGTKVSLAAFYNKTVDAYNIISDYDRFSYIYTGVESVQGMSIPAADRVYSVNPADGSIVVSDRTGKLSAVTIEGKKRNQFVPRTFADNNDNPITRYGLEWVVDFKKIKPINTTIRLDGSFYNYRSIYTDMRAYSPYTTASYDGTPYKYIGYYFGDDSISNGSETRTLKTNLTVTTNIPKVRMIVSMKIEACLLHYSRALSERPGADRSHVIADRQDLLSGTGGSIYDGQNYTVFFPDYYASYDDPAPRPYYEDLERARSEDPALFSDLSKLAVTSSFLYQFSKDNISPYFSANFSVTKEIGDLASISLYANNFFNNLSQVYSTRTATYNSVSSYIPKLYYGLTVRLKF